MKTFRITGHVKHVKTNTNEIKLEGEDDMEVRDEWHSMHELYQHRMALCMHLFPLWHEQGRTVCKSKLHSDGTMFDGYFIIQAIHGNGQVSYHYKMEHWDKFRIPEMERAPVSQNGYLDTLSVLMGERR